MSDGDESEQREPHVSARPGPLAGIRVFDVTMFMAGPWATMMLGSLGAEVLHVEQPDVAWGQLNAGTPPLINGTASGYIAWNMNKRGVFLNFKDAGDLEFAYELISTCDVFVSNMRPLERMGLGYDKLRSINERLVYCHGTGYGKVGPRAGEWGSDASMQAFSGFWSTQGARGGDPEIYRHATQLDAVTGNLLAQAALLGLHARRRTGRGQCIDVSMVDAAATLQTPRLAEHLAGTVHRPQGSSAFSTAPDRAFRCQDGRWVGISVSSEHEWRQLCGALKEDDLVADERFSSNAARVAHREALEDRLADSFATMPLAYWELALSRARVPFGAMLRWEELRHHAQVLDNDYLVEIETDAWGTVWTGGPPWRLSRTPARMAGPAIPGIDTWALKDELQRAGLREQ
jgi:crotonobetainyl-CoA:carnitine CoA-transferase CaiB-like acyl-CoA transferase